MIYNIIIIPKVNTEYPLINAPKETSPEEKKYIINDITLAIISDL